MKKKIFIITIILLIIISTIFIYISKNVKFKQRESYTYNPEEAVKYSYTCIFEKDPNFPEFEANCTQYISQCLLAGGLKLDGKNTTSLEETKIVPTTNEWFCYSWDISPYKPVQYYISSSFCNLQDFITYWTKVAGVPYTKYENTRENRELIRKEKVKVGDVLVLKSDECYHLMLVSRIDKNHIYYNGNTVSRNEYPLSYLDEKLYYEVGVLNFVR